MFEWNNVRYWFGLLMFNVRICYFKCNNFRKIFVNVVGLVFVVVVVLVNSVVVRV